MNVISSASYYSAVRKHGVCQGTLWRQLDSSSSSHKQHRTTATTKSPLMLLQFTPTKSSSSSSNSTTTTTAFSSSSDKQTCDYCVLIGARLDCYESRAAYQKGDLPVGVLHVVGAAAQMSATAATATTTSTTTTTTTSASELAFRLVTNQGTHWTCQATSRVCAQTWLAAFQAGLELALLQQQKEESNTALHIRNTPLIPPAPQATIRRGLLQPLKRYCISCGAVEGTAPLSPAKHNSSALRTLRMSTTTTTTTSSSSSSPDRKETKSVQASSSSWTTTTTSSNTTTAQQPSPNSSTSITTKSTTINIGGAVAPLPHYGLEGRVDLCADCETATGLVAHVEFYELALLQAQQEFNAIQMAQQAVWRAIAPTDDGTVDADATSAELAPDWSGATPPISHDDGNDNEGKKEQEAEGNEADGAAKMTETGHDDNKEKEDQVQVHDEAGGEASAMTTAATLLDGDTSSPHSSESWSHVGSDDSTPSPPPDITSAWQTVDPALTPPQQQQSWIHLPPTESSTKELMQLLQDPIQFGALAKLSPFLETLAQELVNGQIGVPDFLEQLDEAAGKRGDDSLVELKKQAFRVAGDMGSAMKLLLDSALPARETVEKTQVLVCLLDFLLDLCHEDELSTVAFFWPQLCHVHLRMLPPENAAQVARVDLVEEFLLTVASQYSIHLALELIWSHTADLEESLQSSTCSVPCRRRRFAVLRFVCELESILFDFDDCWGGGSVSLGRMLAPTSHQVGLLKERMKNIQELRKIRPIRLARSARLFLLSSSKRDMPPEEAAKEKLRIAKNADYFSCHLNFSRRLADIADKLHHMDISQRAEALEEELTLLNASGTMGGDPLNLVNENLVRVVRVPSTEGHVFRSKERTPVLLLMEVIDEGLELPIADSPSARYRKKHAKSSSDSLHADDEATEEVLGKETQDGSADACQVDERSSSPSPTQMLEGSEYALRPSPKPGALKRFKSESSTGGDEHPNTPKKMVELMVNSAVVQQLQVIKVPNLSDALQEAEINDSKPPVMEVSLEAGSRGDGDIVSPEVSDNVVKSASSPTGSTSELKGAKKMSTLGNLGANTNDHGDKTNALAPTGDVRREVLNAIMMQGLQGNTIAAGTAISLQRSLQELERKRATELILSGDDAAAQDEDYSSERDAESTREKLAALGISMSDDEIKAPHTEEDEVMEAIRLLLIQNRVAQGQLSPADAAKVLQHASLNKVTSLKDPFQRFGDQQGSGDESEFAIVDAGDVDRRLVGCGPVPPAVLQALTLWKGGMVNHAELLELVKKDAAFVRHSVLLDAENVDKLNEDSAFWGRFAFGERWAEKKSRIASSSPQGATPGWDLVGVIVKSNDDLRQEAFVMQLIKLCQEAFDLAGLELWVSPYRILATGRTTGVIEMVRNAMSFDALKKRPGYGKGGLREHLQRMTEFTADPGEAFKSAQLNFVRSLAAYSLLSYFFMFKDRHNGNILLDTAGHVIHIDFGFVFGQAPGGSFSLEMSTPFKLTEEMLDVMGGLRSPLFSEFVTLFCCGFLAFQSYRDTFLTIVEITCENSTFKCFDGKDTAEIVSKLRERFCPNLKKEETVSFALDLIKQATTSYGTRQYDLFQYMSQGIAA